MLFVEVKETDSVPYCTAQVYGWHLFINQQADRTTEMPSGTNGFWSMETYVLYEGLSSLTGFTQWIRARDTFHYKVDYVNAETDGKLGIESDDGYYRKSVLSRKRTRFSISSTDIGFMDSISVNEEGFVRVRLIRAGFISYGFRISYWIGVCMA